MSVQWEIGSEHGAYMTEVVHRAEGRPTNVIALVRTRRMAGVYRDEQEIIDWPEGVASLHLIAAAPELLEVLDSILSYVVTDVVESCHGNKCREVWCAGCFGDEYAEKHVAESNELLNRARAAIAKARGES